MSELQGPQMPKPEADVERGHDTNQIVEGVWGELMRDKVYDYVETVEGGETTETLALTLTPEDVKKLIEMEKEGTLPDWAGKNQEAYIEELEDMAGLES